ncbi:MAG: carbohydrate-binding domain-containing protein [Halobacteriaceae archaeon]
MHGADRLGVTRPAGVEVTGDTSTAVSAAGFDGGQCRIPDRQIPTATSPTATNEVHRGRFDEKSAWYVFDAEAGEYVVVEFAPDAGRAAVALYGPAGTFLGMAYAGRDEAAVLDGVTYAAGPHYLRPVSVDAVGGYRFLVKDYDYRGRVDGSVADPVAPVGDRRDGYDGAVLEDGSRLAHSLRVEPGRHALVARLAGVVGGTRVRVEVDEETKVTRVPRAGGWRLWRTVGLGTVTLEAGAEHSLRVAVSDGECRFDWVGFVELADTDA